MKATANTIALLRQELTYLYAQSETVPEGSRLGVSLWNKKAADVIKTANELEETQTKDLIAKYEKGQPVLKPGKEEAYKKVMKDIYHTEQEIDDLPINYEQLTALLNQSSVKGSYENLAGVLLPKV